MRFGEELREDGGGAQEQVLIAIDGCGAELVAGFGQGLTVGLVEGLPSPKGFAVDGELVGDLGIGEALEGEVNGPKLEIGDVQEVGNTFNYRRMSQTPGGCRGGKRGKLGKIRAR